MHNHPSLYNNFDLIRLIAALQVVFRHSFYGYDFQNDILNFIKDIILAFPGVPIFFMVSGFLIYWSFDRNSDNLKKYFKNRFFRIYPALWVCLFITITVLLLSDTQFTISQNISTFIIWILGQLSIVQFWTPEFLKSFGEGSPNASLWSICVELQFYFFVPILFFLVKKFSKYKFWIFLTFFVTSVWFNHWISHFEKSDLIYKLGFVSLFQYLFYFMFGVFFYNYWEKIRKLVEQKFILWIGIFLLLHFLCKNHFDIDLNNYYLSSFYKLIFIVLLNFSVLSFAFSYNHLSEKILKKQDISYGIYIYHMLVINIFIENNLSIHHNFGIILLITIVMAAFSWFIIEKPVLKRLRK